MTSVLADLAHSRRPIVTIFLIAINAAVFVYELSLGGLDEFIFFHKYGLIPAELTSGEEVPLLVNTTRGTFGVEVSSSIHPWGTVFSSMFIHGGVLHIVGNMLFLWGFGYSVEEKLGHVKYLLFYLGAGIAAAWAQVAVDLDSQVPMIGASGAISGVLGAYILAFPIQKRGCPALPLLRSAPFFQCGLDRPRCVRGRGGLHGPPGWTSCGGAVHGWVQVPAEGADSAAQAMAAVEIIGRWRMVGLRVLNRA